MMTYEYDESCNAYGPEPHPDDVYKPNSADKARWAAVWARMAHDRNAVWARMAHDRNAERAAERTA